MTKMVITLYCGYRIPTWPVSLCHVLRQDTELLQCLPLLRICYSAGQNALIEPRCWLMYIVLQVINAARTLAARPHSKVARENMDVFKEAWEKQLQVLTEAVDDITGIEDFLATTGESP